MTAFLSWWLAVFLLGLLAFPLSYFTFRHLPDRGWVASRMLGLLVPSYVAWLAGYGLTGATPIVLGLAVLAGLSWFFGRGLFGAHVRFVSANIGYIGAVEILFVVALVAFMAFESSIGAIFQTEKPADFTILHGVMASRGMPPHDPWLSGANISYYYFGYFILGFVGKLTGSAPGLTHNMGVCLIFALTAIMAFSLGTALAKGRRLYGLLLVFALTTMGNLDYWYRVPQVYTSGDLQKHYIAHPPEDPSRGAGVEGVVEFLLNPMTHGWEYFQAARLLEMGPGEHLITEFPAFSFVLADLHPHMISLPFFLLALLFALNLARAPLGGWRLFGWKPPWQILQGLLVALVFGSLGFINSWDLPTVMLVLGTTLALREMWLSGAGAWQWLPRTAAVGLPLLVVAIAAYVPFYVALRSHAKGLALVRHRTDLYDWPFVIGPFLLVLVPALLARVRSAPPQATPASSSTDVPAPRPVEKPKETRRRRAVQRASRASETAARPAGPACVLCEAPPASAEARVCTQCSGEIGGLPLRAEVPPSGVRDLLQKLGQGVAGADLRIVLAVVAAIAIGDHLAPPPWKLGVTAFSLLLAALALGCVAVRSESRELSFAAIVTAIGFLLMTGCEWFFINDLFADKSLYRMNTMFKFYMQAWVLLSVGGVALFAWFREHAWPRWGVVPRRIWTGFAAFVLVGSLAFPIVGVRHHVVAFGSPVSMLDGSEFIRLAMPEDARAIDWLQQNARWNGKKPPVILEAWGMSFSVNGRIATFSGLSTVIGWTPHEEQWRGGKEAPILGGIDPQDNVRRRYEDSDTMYLSRDLPETRRLLERYGVQYVVVGRLEREKYGPQEYGPVDFEKWENLGRLVFQDGETRVYSVSE